MQLTAAVSWFRQAFSNTRRRTGRGYSSSSSKLHTSNSPSMNTLVPWVLAWSFYKIDAPSIHLPHFRWHTSWCTPPLARRHRPLFLSRCGTGNTTHKLNSGPHLYEWQSEAVLYRNPSVCNLFRSSSPPIFDVQYFCTTPARSARFMPLPDSITHEYSKHTIIAHLDRFTTIIREMNLNVRRSGILDQSRRGIHFPYQTVLDELLHDCPQVHNDLGTCNS